MKTYEETPANSTQEALRVLENSFGQNDFIESDLPSKQKNPNKKANNIAKQFIYYYTLSISTVSESFSFSYFITIYNF